MKPSYEEFVNALPHSATREAIGLNLSQSDALELLGSSERARNYYAAWRPRIPASTFESYGPPASTNGGAANAPQAQGRKVHSKRMLRVRNVIIGIFAFLFLVLVVSCTAGVASSSSKSSTVGEYTSNLSAEEQAYADAMHTAAAQPTSAQAYALGMDRDALAAIDLQFVVAANALCAEDLNQAGMREMFHKAVVSESVNADQANVIFDITKGYCGQ